MKVKYTCTLEIADDIPDNYIEDVSDIKEIKENINMVIKERLDDERVVITQEHFYIDGNDKYE